MSISNPMEDVFIRIIEDTVARIFRHERDAADEFRELQAHLEKARRLGWQRYEAKTLNALAILHSKDDEAALKLYRAAVDVADQTDDWMLQANLRNNLGSSYYDIYDFEQAREHFNDAVNILNTQSERPVVYLFLQANLALLAMLVGQYDDARDRLEAAQAMASEISLTGKERHSYARGIYLIRTTLLRVEIAEGDGATARASLDFIQELVAQLQTRTAVLNLYEAYIALMIDKDEAAYHAWVARLRQAAPRFPNNHLLEVLFLNSLGYRELALQWARDALAQESDNQRLRAHLQAFIDAQDGTIWPDSYA